MARPVSAGPSVPTGLPPALLPGPDEGAPGGLAVVVLDAAAGRRPAGEVAELLRLLAGHTFPGADAALRGAAVGRAVADVAELVTALGEDDPATVVLLGEAVLRRPVDDVAALATALGERAAPALGRALAEAAWARPVGEVAEMVRSLPVSGPRPLPRPSTDPAARPSP
ncbi:hypothetical protein ACFV0G_37105, partial [Kitasatospora sp. NPDC059571]